MIFGMSRVKSWFRVDFSCPVDAALIGTCAHPKEVRGKPTEKI